jgi:hypothetical protein
LDYFELYKNRLKISGDNYSEINKSLLKKKINNSFEDSPSYVECEIINKLGISQVKGVIVTDNNTLSKTNNSKIVLMKPYDNIEIGDLIKYNSDIWLCTMKDEMVGLYDRAVMEKSNYNLTFLNSSNTPTTIPCIVEDAVKYSSGVNDSKTMSLPDGQLLITLPNTEQTQQITKQDYRLMLYKKAFKVTYDNRTQDGLVKLTVVQENRQDKDTDEIAYNGLIVTPITPTGTLIIDGSDSLIIKLNQTYTVKMDDNSPYTGVYTFSLSDNSLASIVSNTAMSCTLKGLVKGNVVLTAVNLNSGLTITKNITIKSLM